MLVGISALVQTVVYSSHGIQMSSRGSNTNPTMQSLCNTSTTTKSHHIPLMQKADLHIVDNSMASPRRG